ncbi:MAG: glycosyltransferase [Solirubrobacterales bacterium]|nr:glycosyltransferase [Solirubrobacterales bacterium]
MTPLFSVLTPVYEPPLAVLRETIQSVRDQTFMDWELILVDDNSPSDHVRSVLREAAASDGRIRVVERAVNGGIVAASNDAVAAGAGAFFALLDHDDLLTARALEVMARAIAQHGDADYLYSDEDKIDSTGTYSDVFRKPDWSPERLRHQMYTCHLSVLRASVVREVGGFHEGFEGSQDHDIVLRVSERARRIVHVPEVLYHWRILPGSAAVAVGEKPYAWESGRRAVQAHLDRLGIAATVDLGPRPGMYRVRRLVDYTTPVSLIIPTRGASGSVWGERRCFVVETVRSALAKTQMTGVEIVVVYDEAATPTATLDEVARLCGDRYVSVPFSREFNFSEKCNLGFLASTGEVVVLLNDDVEVISDGWLEELVAPIIQEADVGMTGARLHFSDMTLQHAGHRYGERSWSHAFLGEVNDEEVDFGALALNREVSGATAACAAIRRDVFEEVGGLTEELPGNFNDIDLSLKITRAGYRILWMAHSALFHFESRSRERIVHQWEIDAIIRRWGEPDRDPYVPNS